MSTHYRYDSLEQEHGPFMNQWTYVQYMTVTPWNDSHWRYRWIHHGKQGHGHSWNIQTLEMPGFVTLDLITADARVSHRATARFDTLPTAAVPGPPRRPHIHPMETWHTILGLALYRHPCMHTFVFLASQATFPSYDTTGTVVTQIYHNVYLLWYHGNSHGDSGETYNAMGTVTETVVRLTIPQEQCWDSDCVAKIFLMTEIHDKMMCRTTW